MQMSVSSRRSRATDEGMRSTSKSDRGDVSDALFGSGTGKPLSTLMAIQSSRLAMALVRVCWFSPLCFPLVSFNECLTV